VPYAPSTALPALGREHPYAIALRDGYTAFAKGDLDYIREILAEDVVHSVTGRSRISGDHRGQDEVLDFYVRVFELSGGTFHSEPYSFLADDHHGVVLVHTMAERAGRTLDDRGVDVHRFVDGRITEIRSVAGDQHAVDAFWS
jgi:ketosteroid isomerase-like protein